MHTVTVTVSLTSSNTYVAIQYKTLVMHSHSDKGALFCMGVPRVSGAP
jgi:hypothetical protein